MIKLRSPEADEFPPGHADGEPHDGVDRADDEAVAPPFALAHVACAEIDGDGAVAVVGERDGKVGEDAEGDRDHQGGQCIRVPVLNGHTAAVFVKFKKKPTKEQLIEKLESYSGAPQALNLPSAPKQFMRYMTEDNRPQVTEDVNYENGMGISIGRIREDSIYDYKFVGLSHNTVRGAAGGAVLCAELLKAKGFITKK